MQADDDSAKSAASDCFERCAALLGVGRYLYRDGVPVFAREAPKPTNGNGHPGNGNGHPGNGKPRTPPPATNGESHRPTDRLNFPQDGRHLFAWLKEQDRSNPGLFDSIADWGTRQGFSSRTDVWAVILEAREDREQIVAAMAAIRLEDPPPVDSEGFAGFAGAQTQDFPNFSVY